MAMADNIVMSEMTWAEVEEAMKDRPVGILPVGAIEAHGPHLPLNADTVIAIEMAKRGAAKLKEHGVSALILPPVSFTVSDFAAKFPGTISVPAATSVALLRDVCVATAKSSARIAMASIHLDPGISRCLKAALEEAKKLGASVCWATSPEALGGLLGRPSRRSDHAGAFETSLMMAAAPAAWCASASASAWPRRRTDARPEEGAKTFARRGEDAYFGDPPRPAPKTARPRSRPWATSSPSRSWSTRLRG